MAEFSSVGSWEYERIPDSYGGYDDRWICQSANPTLCVVRLSDIGSITVQAAYVDAKHVEDLRGVLQQIVEALK